MKVCNVAFSTESQRKTCIHSFKSGGTFKQTILAASVCLFLAGSAPAAIIISEVAPWSSGNSSLAADWFELTNTGGSSVNVTGWKMDDGSNSFATSVALNGITNIAAGESVIFTESAASLAAAFKTLWFGANPPAGLQIGNYDGTGAGVGMSSGGDGVSVFDSGGALQARVSFGASPTGPFPTFDNTAGLTGAISQLSAVGVNGAFAAVNSVIANSEIGSPGAIGRAVPEPGSVLLLALGAGALAFQKRRRLQS